VLGIGDQTPNIRGGIGEKKGHRELNKYPGKRTHWVDPEPIIEQEVAP
jgi:hypothetical protein